jgi:hypothetical protein
VEKHKNEIEKIAQEIQLYLFKHPNAADTLEGITKWWLQRLRYEETTEIVHKALQYLIDCNYVLQTTNSDGSSIYKIFKRDNNQLQTN